MVPDFADLKTRNCSEAYYKYYMQQRFYYMRDLLSSTIIPKQCAAGIVLNMTQLLYYSQFTEGDIYFSTAFSNQGSGTLADIATCSANVANYVTIMNNWCPEGYKDSTSFLKNNFQYTQGCDLLHIKPERWVAEYSGWGCPTALGGVGAGSAVTYSFFTLVCLVIVQHVTKYLS